MPDLIPFAVIHIGVSVALAAMLILMHRRLHRADFLLYWAIFWLAIAANLAAGRVAHPLIPRGTTGALLAVTFAQSLLPFYPVLMICAALSLGGDLSKRMARTLLAGAGVLAVLIGVYAWMRPGTHRALSPFVVYRPIVTSLAVAFFAYRLAVKGRHEVGPARSPLVALCMVYSVHNLALGWNPPGLHILGCRPLRTTVRNRPAGRCAILAGGNREVMVQWYHTSLRDIEGAIIGAAGLGLDLSQQRLLEEQILQRQKLETLGQLAGGLRRLMREEVVLEIDSGPEIGYTLADPGHLDQMVLNLVVNANDAIAGAGRIRLVTRRFSRNHTGTSEGRGPQEFVVLSVEDNGSGMSDRTRQRIFEPFFTTKAEVEGTGLGLSTVHGAVVQAGGWIDVTSQLGVGSTFSVYLPRTESPQEAELAAPAPACAPIPGTVTVLLVEDQEMVRRFASDVLTGRGYRVVEASNGVEALNLAADASLEISVLVTDVVMPQMSGPELAGRMEELRPGLRTLFVSGYSFDQEFGPEPLSPKRAYLQKPYTPEQLCRQGGIAGRNLLLTSALTGLQAKSNRI